MKLARWCSLSTFQLYVSGVACHSCLDSAPFRLAATPTLSHACTKPKSESCGSIVLGYASGPRRACSPPKSPTPEPDPPNIRAPCPLTAQAQAMSIPFPLGTHRQMKRPSFCIVLPLLKVFCREEVWRCPQALGCLGLVGQAQPSYRTPTPQQ